MKIVGIDCGTGNLLVAVQDEKDSSKVIIKRMRNSYVPITQDDIAVAQMSGVPIEYVEKYDSDGELEIMAVVGEDAFRLSNIFNSEVKRPMKDGVISNTDIDSIDVLSIMCKKLAEDGNDGLIVYSIPAQSVDRNIAPVTYHEKVFEKIFKSIGYKYVKSLNEGQAVIFAETAKEHFTGIGISFGAGMVNVSASYRGTPTLQFSIARSGDWIDNSVGQSLNLIPNKVASVKENDLDLNNPEIGNKKTRKVREALVFYYQSLIEYVLEEFINQFKKASDNLEIDEEVPIILSGGTSLPTGFDELFKTTFQKYKEEFPYNISEIRRASNPMDAVGKGCLIYAHWIAKKEKLI